MLLFIAQLLSHIQLFAAQWAAARQVSLSFTISQSLLKFMSIESVMPSSHFNPLSPPSPAVDLSQHQGLFQWVGSSHQVAKVLEPALASFLSVNIQGWFPLRLNGLISLLSKGLSRVFSRTTVWKHQFFRCSAFFIVQLSLPHMTMEESYGLLSAKQCLCFLTCCLALT